MDFESKVVIAVISASSAIAGAIISQVVTLFRDFLNKKQVRNVLLRDKYEELANLITSSQEWIASQLTAKTLTELRNSPPLDARKAMIISHIYFPLLRKSCEQYINSCARFQTVLIDNHKFIEGIDCGTQAVQNNSEAVEQASKQLQISRHDLEDLIIKYATKYAKA